MKKPIRPVPTVSQSMMLEPELSRYIWTHTKKQQLFILTIVALSMIPYFLSFNLPKQIVNGPIQGQGFDTDTATQLFMQLSLPIPFIGDVQLFPGIPLERFPMLMALSFVFLGLVVINGLFKFYINTYKGRLGERLLRRIRFDLIDRILRFPPQTFKRLKGAEVSSMVKDEVEPLGGFTGDAFVLPALLGGQALTALVFIYLQSVPLGLITTALVAVQVLIIPRMRRRLLVLGRERQLTARELAGRVSEIVDGIHTIHAYDTSNYERADVAARLGRIFKIRYDIYQWKFMVKFINNFLASVTPFLFYSVGGYLALNGRLDIGQLVAVIGAYKDLPGPLKDLIDWDQARQDVQVKYQQVVGQFAIDRMIDPKLHEMNAGDTRGHLKTPLAAVNLGVIDDSGSVSLERVNFTLHPGESVCIVGPAGSGGDTLAEALARIVWPTSGRITSGDQDLNMLPESVSGRSISFAGNEAYFFFGTVRDNLLYALKHAPLSEFVYEGAGEVQRRWEQQEARWAGNPDYDLKSNWINFAGAGVTGPEDLMERVLKVLNVVGLGKDVLDLALRSTVDPSRYGDLAPKVVAMRQALRDELIKEDLDGLIEPFEAGAYNTEATVSENLLFGNARGASLMAGVIGENAYFRKVLADHGLDAALYATGYEIARNAIELFADLPPDHPFFQQLTFMTSEDIPVYQLLLNKLDGVAYAAAAEADRTAMIRLSFDYIEPRHRFGLLTPELMENICAFRKAFHDGLPADLKDAIEQYSPGEYLASAGLLDNILFGRISQKYRDGSDRIYTAVGNLLRPLGLYDTVLSIGLDFHIGAGGKRLSAAQRQKLAMARALLRQSDYYVFNRPLSTLDGRAQEQIIRATLAYLAEMDPAPGIVWVLSNTTLTQLFDRVAVFDRGALVEEGRYEALLEKNGIFKQMIAS